MPNQFGPVDQQFEDEFRALLESRGLVTPGSNIYVEAINSTMEFGVDTQPVQHLMISVRAILPTPTGGIFDIKKVPKARHTGVKATAVHIDEAPKVWTLEEVRQKARELDAPPPE